MEIVIRSNALEEVGPSAIGRILGHEYGHANHAVFHQKFTPLWQKAFPRPEVSPDATKEDYAKLGFIVRQAYENAATKDEKITGKTEVPQSYAFENAPNTVGTYGNSFGRIVAQSRNEQTTALASQIQTTLTQLALPIEQLIRTITIVDALPGVACLRQPKIDDPAYDEIAEDVATCVELGYCPEWIQDLPHLHDVIQDQHSKIYNKIGVLAIAGWVPEDAQNRLINYATQ